MTSFLGMSSLTWQFISGLLSTMIIGICMGVVSSKWLNKRDLLNAEEGKLLVQRVDSYMKWYVFKNIWILHVSFDAGGTARCNIGAGRS